MGFGSSALPKKGLPSGNQLHGLLERPPIWSQPCLSTEDATAWNLQRRSAEARINMKAPDLKSRSGPSVDMIGYNDGLNNKLGIKDEFSINKRGNSKWTNETVELTKEHASKRLCSPWNLGIHTVLSWSHLHETKQKMSPDIIVKAQSTGLLLLCPACLPILLFFWHHKQDMCMCPPT